jgi:hypothetical protein
MDDASERRADVVPRAGEPAGPARAGAKTHALTRTAGIADLLGPRQFLFLTLC